MQSSSGCGTMFVLHAEAMPIRHLNVKKLMNIVLKHYREQNFVF